MWQMRQYFVAQFVQLKCWLCHVQSGIVENGALSVDQCRLQALQFSVHLIYLLSILFRCNGFTRIQRAVVDQTGSRPPVTMTFFFFLEVLWSLFSVHSLSWLSHKNPLFVTNNHRLRNGSLLLHRIREDDTSKMCFCFFFLLCSQLMRHSLTELFHLSSLL